MQLLQLHGGLSHNARVLQIDPSVKDVPSDLLLFFKDKKKYSKLVIILTKASFAQQIIRVMNIVYL